MNLAFLHNRLMIVDPSGSFGDRGWFVFDPAEKYVKLYEISVATPVDFDGVGATARVARPWFTRFLGDTAVEQRQVAGSIEVLFSSGHQGWKTDFDTVRTLVGGEHWNGFVAVLRKTFPIIENTP
jgi:hypothetical protein